MSAPIVSVVVVTHRRWDLLEPCLGSILAARESAGVPMELVVVDNGSDDETGARVGARFPVARMVTLAEHAGFSPAVMSGIRESRGEWVALLNNDLTVEPTALRALLDAGRSHPDVGAVAAQMRFAGQPGTINSAGLEVDQLGVVADRLLGRPVDASEPETVEVFGASAGAALYRRAMLDEIGGFDETFFAYLEDADVAWRARMSGWRALYAPHAVVYHHHSATLGHRSTRKYFLVGRNRVRLLAKNATRGQLVRQAARIALYDLGYVAYVAGTERTLAPIAGRIAGLREWRTYRRVGAASRRSVPLRRTGGFREALRRDRAWPVRSEV